MDNDNELNPIPPHEDLPAADHLEDLPQEASEPDFTYVDVQPIMKMTERIQDQIGQVIIGQQEPLDMLLVALLSDGHVLLEGVPGIAKTLSAKLLAKTIESQFSRIQFTPDLMPTDILGTNIFNLKVSEFSFSPGPIFANIVLIDEINRAPAKTQSALFESMEERQITIDGTTYPLDDVFLVIATQNPIEQEGTYKLPEAQLDRFLFKVNMEYPSLDNEIEILQRFKSSYLDNKIDNVQPVITMEELTHARALVQQVHIGDSLINYIASLVNETRHNSNIFLGASPRASLAILISAKAYAAINGRDFVIPDDIQYVAYPVLNHRLILSPEREMEGGTTTEVIKEIIQKVEVPR